MLELTQDESDQIDSYWATFIRCCQRNAKKVKTDEQVYELADHCAAVADRKVGLPQVYKDFHSGQVDR